MDESDMYRLDSIRSDLLQSLDANHIVDYLIEQEVLDTDHDEQIKAELTSKQRTEKLLQILPDTTPYALKHLREALQTDYGFIVKKLDKVQVPVNTSITRSHNGPGSGGLQTAAGAAFGGNRSTANGTSTTSTCNISGDGNFVIVGGSKTTINYR